MTPILGLYVGTDRQTDGQTDGRTEGESLKSMNPTVTVHLLLTV